MPLVHGSPLAWYEGWPTLSETMRGVMSAAILRETR